MYSRRGIAWCRFVVLTCALLMGAAASAQDRDKPVLRVDGLTPGGLRTSVTESWGTFDFAVTNFSDKDRIARVMMFYEDRPEVQYGRDVWVPAKSSLHTWLLAGPIPPDEQALKEPKVKGPPKGPPLARRRDVQSVLYDKTDGKEELILPRSEERVRSRVVPYRQRESYTCIMLDPETYKAREPGSLPPEEPRSEAAMELMRTFRLTRELSGIVTAVPMTPLPPTPDAYDGIDHFVIAGNRIADDPGGLRAVRQWVERGGRAWVMLDMTDLDSVAPLLGDAIDFQVLDRVSLSTFKIQTQINVAGPRRETDSFTQSHERPVEFVRVLLPKEERVRHTIDGYPVWFTRELGRGKVIFSTLGPRGWYRARTKADPKSPYDNFPLLGVPLPALEFLGDHFHPQQEEAFRPEAFQRTLTEEIGYQVVDRSVVALVFGGFLLGTLLLGLILRRVGRGELLGWVAPLAALAAAGAFFGLGESSRRQVPPTVSQGQIIEAATGSPEVSVRGLLALYRPDSGPAPMGAQRGGVFDLDMKGISGTTRRLVLTDSDAWHWENLSLPAGVRIAAFRQALQTPKPLSAVARFGPNGVVGVLTKEPFEAVEDAMIRTAGGWTLGRDVAVRLKDDGTFACSTSDILAPYQYLASTYLSDEQQRRQGLYRQFLDAEPEASKIPGVTEDNRSLAKKASARHLEGKNVLMAWAKPIDTHFDLVPGARQAGSALLVVPMTFERPAPGTQVTIPGPFIPHQRMKDGLPLRLTTEGRQDANMLLRFQLPDEVLPLTPERVRLNFRIDAPSRQVRITAVPDGKEDGERVEVASSLSPLDPVQVDITDAKLLRLDERGGLHLNLEMRTAKAGGNAASGRRASAEDEKWTIHHLEIEVTGKTAP